MAVDVRGFVTGFIMGIVGILVAVTVLPLIGQAITSANLTGTQAALAGIIPNLATVGVVLFAVSIFF